MQDVIRRDSQGTSPETQAFMLRASSELGRDVSSLSAVLFERRFEMSIEARANLAMALYKNGNTAQSRRIRNELVSLAKNSNDNTLGHFMKGLQIFWQQCFNDSPCALFAFPL